MSSIYFLYCIYNMLGWHWRKYISYNGHLVKIYYMGYDIQYIYFIIIFLNFKWWILCRNYILYNSNIGYKDINWNWDLIILVKFFDYIRIRTNITIHMNGIYINLINWIKYMYCLASIYQNIVNMYRTRSLGYSIPLLYAPIEGWRPYLPYDHLAPEKALGSIS